MMCSWADVFALFSGPTDLGRAIGVDRRHAAVMRMRGQVPPAYWGPLVSSARGITLEVLVQLKPAADAAWAGDAASSSSDPASPPAGSEAVLSTAEVAA